MTRLATTGRHQFQLRSVLAAITWLALVLAVCVQHQRTSTRQREVREHLTSIGFQPLGAVTVSAGNASPRPAALPVGFNPSAFEPASLDISPLPST